MSSNKDIKEYRAYFERASDCLQRLSLFEQVSEDLTEYQRDSIRSYIEEMNKVCHSCLVIAEGIAC